MQAYHSGAFNGNDLDKLYDVDVIAQLSSVLAPRRVFKHMPKDGNLNDHGNQTTSRTFGSLEMAEKFSTLLHKLRQLKNLYRPTRPLCKHEVRPLLTVNTDTLRSDTAGCTSACSCDQPR
jgi:hypothetical protein